MCFLERICMRSVIGIFFNLSVKSLVLSFNLFINKTFILQPYRALLFIIALVDFARFKRDETYSGCQFPKASLSARNHLKGRC